MSRDKFTDDISFVQSIIDRIGFEKMEAMHRIAWDVIAQSASKEEIVEMTKIIQAMRDSGLVVSFKPEIKMIVAEFTKTVVH